MKTTLGPDGGGGGDSGGGGGDALSGVPDPAPGGYDDSYVQEQIQKLLSTGEDPAIQAEYERLLGEGYRAAEMGAASRGVTGYGGVRRSKESVRDKALIEKTRASAQQRAMNQQIAIQWTQQAFNNKQLDQQSALAMVELQIGAGDWIHENHPEMAKYLPDIQARVAKYIEKNPNDYIGAVTLYSNLFNEALVKSGVS